ncbi:MULTISPECIES: hypothetical protein [Bradyrhizobium]|uniref:hypothetical protein n=1 Tax=Bradyrhizobium TaxID=374 RepID=UPI001008BC5F|nr:MULTISPECIES: hypothetical protein [Bradyrhizobium]UQR60227.1 hypothetical protein LRP30_24720 [Bradyrhizobium sp. C-145]
MVPSSRERPVLLEPAGRGLLGVTLRFAQDIRNEADYFSEIPEMKLPSEMMKLAQHIIVATLYSRVGVALPERNQKKR